MTKYLNNSSFLHNNRNQLELSNSMLLGVIRDYESVGREFESLQARQLNKGLTDFLCRLFFFVP